jgi:hypothetical protein
MNNVPRKLDHRKNVSTSEEKWFRAEQEGSRNLGYSPLKESRERERDTNWLNDIYLIKRHKGMLPKSLSEFHRTRSKSSGDNPKMI